MSFGNDVLFPFCRAVVCKAQSNKVAQAAAAAVAAASLLAGVRITLQL
jgi:hypothetical protein